MAFHFDACTAFWLRAIGKFLCTKTGKQRKSYESHWLKLVSAGSVVRFQDIFIHNFYIISYKMSWRSRASSIAITHWGRLPMDSIARNCLSIETVWMYTFCAYHLWYDSQCSSFCLFFFFFILLHLLDLILFHGTDTAIQPILKCWTSLHASYIVFTFDSVINVAPFDAGYF